MSLSSLSPAKMARLYQTGKSPTSCESSKTDVKHEVRTSSRNLSFLSFFLLFQDCSSYGWSAHFVSVRPHSQTQPISAFFNLLLTSPPSLLHKTARRVGRFSNSPTVPISSSSLLHPTPIVLEPSSDASCDFLLYRKALYDEQVAVLGQPDGSFRPLEYDDRSDVRCFPPLSSSP